MLQSSTPDHFDHARESSSHEPTDADVSRLLHEIRNTLAVIRLSAQYIDRITQDTAAPTERINQRARVILESVDKAAEQLDSARQATRIKPK